MQAWCIVRKDTNLTDYAITMNEIFDEFGNYIYPNDVVLDEPNTVIGYIPLKEQTDERSIDI